jgi:hypothetical protein
MKISRKSQEEGVMIFSSLMLLMIVMLVFGAVTLFGQKNTSELKLIKLQAEDSRISLLNYLRTPYANPKYPTIQDLIVGYNYDSSLEQELSVATSELFSGLYGKCYFFSINDEAGKILLKINSKKKYGVASSQKIPLPDGKNLIVGLDVSEFYRDCSLAG